VVAGWSSVNDIQEVCGGAGATGGGTVTAGAYTAVAPVGPAATALNPCGAAAGTGAAGYTPVPGGGGTLPPLLLGGVCFAARSTRPPKCEMPAWASAAGEGGGRGAPGVPPALSSSNDCHPAGAGP
jgi:hypothetical protein